MEISNFTPCQTLMLTQPFTVTGRDLFKYCFMNLVFKGVLQVYQEWRKPHPNHDRERLYTFVSRGKNYSDKSTELRFQSSFTSLFQKEDYEYQFRQAAKRAFMEAGGEKGFKGAVYRNLRRENAYFPSLGLKRWSIFIYTPHGFKLRRKFNSILKEADQKLLHSIKQKKSDALEIITKLGTNIILLDSFNHELFEELKKYFEQLKDEDSSNLEGLESLEYFGENLSYFMDSLDSFEVVFDVMDSGIEFTATFMDGINLDIGDVGIGDFLSIDI